jgi:hypothetical protein
VSSHGGAATASGEQGAYARSGPRSIARAIHTGLALLFPVGLLVQVFLAGLGVFDSPQAFATHREVGYTLSLVPVVLAVVGLIAGVPRRLTGLAALIFVLFVLQSVFVAVRGDAPSLAALHPVNGFVITILAFVIARDAWAGRAGALPAPR